MAFLLVVCNVYGQPSRPGIRQLADLIGDGSITLSAAGNGDASGFAVDGYLKNNTANRINVNIILENGIYLKNSGKGQNMIAVQIFQSDGQYFSDGKSHFIAVPAGGRLEIVFNAFSANFDLPNPTSKQTFSVAPIPLDIEHIAIRISKYAALIFNSDVDHTVAIQLAIWRSQGKTRAEITRKLNISNENWELSAKIMNGEFLVSSKQ